MPHCNCFVLFSSAFGGLSRPPSRRCAYAVTCTHAARAGGYLTSSVYRSGYMMPDTRRANHVLRTAGTCDDSRRSISRHAPSCVRQSTASARARVPIRPRVAPISAHPQPSCILGSWVLQPAPSCLLAHPRAFTDLGGGKTGNGANTCERPGDMLPPEPTT